jgi:hypothetical protein
LADPVAPPEGLHIGEAEQFEGRYPCQQLMCPVGVGSYALLVPDSGLLALLCVPLEGHEVVHQLVQGGAGLRRELLGARAVHRVGGGTELVGAPGQ